MVTRTSGVPWLDLPQWQPEQRLQSQAGLDRVRRENRPPDCSLTLLTR